VCDEKKEFKIPDSPMGDLSALEEELRRGSTKPDSKAVGLGLLAVAGELNRLVVVGEELLRYARLQFSNNAVPSMVVGSMQVHPEIKIVDWTQQGRVTFLAGSRVAYVPGYARENVGFKWDHKGVEYGEATEDGRADDRILVSFIGDTSVKSCRCQDLVPLTEEEYMAQYQRVTESREKERGACQGRD